MEYVDLYCERLGPGLLAEPVNTLTNVAFFIAAWALWRLARDARSLSGDVQALVALIVAIGIGSTLFHTFATTWARVLDVVPILLFQLAFLWLYARQVLGWRAVPTAGFVALFLATALYGRQFPHLLGGSLTYAPAIAVILALGLYHWLSGKPEPLLLVAAAGVFVVSLFFRTIDETVCPLLPFGTHFLWHLLNGIVLYLSGRSLLPSERRNISTATAFEKG